MENPRAVRIPRSGPPRVASGSREGPSPSERTPVDRRRNRSGTQRAVRLTVLYLVALLALYLAFVAYGRSAPGGSSTGAQQEMLLFAGFAVFLGAFGVVFSLTPAPRAIEVSSRHLVVVGRWGHRTVWPPIGETTVRVVRRYSAGVLSSSAVESVEVWSTGRRPRSYLVEEGLFSPLAATP